MSSKRFPFRDPRTVARDIPGILDIIFPRLNGGLVTSLNKKLFKFNGFTAISDEWLASSKLQMSMLFELSMARSEQILSGDSTDWDACLDVATRRQKRHFDAKIPTTLEGRDIYLAEWSAKNLVLMLRSVMEQRQRFDLLASPEIPGLGWISSGEGDFSLGTTLIEVKHTDRNFFSGDFRQLLMYWILKSAASIESEEEIWSDFLLLNPRRNAALSINFDELIRSASSGLSRVEVYELLRSLVENSFDSPE